MGDNGTLRYRDLAALSSVVPPSHNGDVENSSLLAASETSVGTSKPADQYREVEHILYSRVIVAICIFGVIGNVLNLVILSKKKISHGMRSLEGSANIGLLALSASDLMACICMIPLVYVDFTDQIFTNAFEAFYSAHAHALTNIFVLCSTWLIVSMATSRYIAVCHPMRAVTLIRTKQTKIATGLIVVFCFLLVLPHFWENDVSKVVVAPPPKNVSITYWFKFNGYFKNHHAEHMVYICVYFVIGLIVPFVMLVFCNVSLVRSLQASYEVPNAPSEHLSQRSSGTRRLTLTLVIIVVMYIILNVPAEVIRFMDQVAESGERSGAYNLAVALLNTLQVLNFAFNFILYCVISPHFRNCLKDWLYACLVLLRLKQTKDRSGMGESTRYTMDTRVSKDEAIALRTDCCSLRELTGD